MEFKKREIDYKNELMEMGDVIRFADNPRIKDETLAMHVTRMMMFASGFISYVCNGSNGATPSNIKLFKSLLCVIFAHDVDELKLGDVSWNIKSRMSEKLEPTIADVSRYSILETKNKSARFTMGAGTKVQNDLELFPTVSIVHYLDVYDAFYVFYKKDFDNKDVLEKCYERILIAQSNIKNNFAYDVGKLEEVTSSLQEGRFILNE